MCMCHLTPATGTNSTVRRLLQWAGSALDACTRLLRHLDAHGFKEGG